MNNLYGWAMSDYLPYGSFKWLKNVDNFDVKPISKKSPMGYIFKVDLEYPDELHVFHNDYPLAPEKLAITYDMLSDYCKKIADEYKINSRNLQLYLPLRMKLTKIHRVIKFKQSDWMKKYIDFNTEKRTNAANSFEKDFLN